MLQVARENHRSRERGPRPAASLNARRETSVCFILSKKKKRIKSEFTSHESREASSMKMKRPPSRLRARDTFPNDPYLSSRCIQASAEAFEGPRRARRNKKECGRQHKGVHLTDQ